MLLLLPDTLNFVCRFRHVTSVSGISIFVSSMREFRISGKMYFWSFALLILWCRSAYGNDQNLRTCEPIRVELCKNLGYNKTGMPNLVGHDLQGDADFTLQTFSPLIQYGCSAQLQFFLCSVYVPMCTDKVPVAIGPCRGLCESVYARCFPVLQGFGFMWPSALECSKFPQENNHEHMCMEGPGEKDNPAVAVTPSLARHPPSSRHNIHIAPCAKYSRSNFYVYVNRSGRCAPLCDKDVLFSAKDKKLAEVWLSVSAALCFVSSLLAVFTFLVDSGGGRFRYPERPLAFLALCYNLASVGWGVRAAAGRSAVACHPDPNYTSQLLLSQDGLGNANCAVVFLLLYYFGNAAAVWWVVLTVAWFLSATRRWTHERIQQHSSLFHLAGWGLPAAQTIAVLVLRDVDADELTGTCYVGNQSTRSLLVFVLAPQFTYLVLGTSLLACGLVSLSKRKPTIVRRDIKNNIIADKNEAVIMRLGVFGVLYSIPAACVVASLIYEYYSRDDWLLVPERSQPQPKPSIWIFLLRIFMSLVFGVTSIIWVWSPKVMRAWKRLFRSLGASGPYKQAPVKCHPTLHYYPPPPAPPPSQRTHKHKHAHSHRKQQQQQRKLHGNETLTAV